MPLAFSVRRRRISPSHVDRIGIVLNGLGGYDLLLPPKIVLGWGRRNEVGRLARSLGQRAFLVTGSRTLANNGENARLAYTLTKAGLTTRHLTEIRREPTPDDVDQALDALLAHDPRPGDLVIALGGGSALDLAKALAALALQDPPYAVLDYLEGVGTGRQLVEPALPVVALPTTAGTGSEATKNAVITSYDPPFKKSLRADSMLPRLVVVDPELTVSNPAAVTIHSGMDAITQLIESYLTRRAQPLTRAWIRQALPGALAALPLAAQQADHRPAREHLAHAALVSGICLANSGLGLAHGVAAALGSVVGVSHGLACAVMLPWTLETNRAACRRELAELEAAVTGEPPGDWDRGAESFLARIEQLARQLGVPDRLRELGVEPAHLPALVSGSQGNSLSGNPVELSEPQLAELLERIR